MLRKLVASVLRGEAVEWKEPDESFPDITIANLKVKLCALMDAKRPGCCRIFGYSDAPVGYKAKDDAGREVEVSYHVFLKKSSMLTCCNIDYSLWIKKYHLEQPERRKNLLKQFLVLQHLDVRITMVVSIFDAIVKRE